MAFLDLGKNELIFDAETMGLEPCKHRILCISFIDPSDPEKVVSFYGEDEKEIIEKFWDKIKDTNLLIGFNSRSFDFQFIYMRSFINGIKPDKDPYSVNQLDIREVLYPFNKFMKGKLQEIAEALKLEIKTENGMLMPGYYTAGEWDKIKEHCEEDVRIIYDIYKRSIELGLMDIFKGGKSKNGV